MANKQTEKMTPNAGEKRTWIEDSEDDDIVEVTGESKPKAKSKMRKDGQNNQVAKAGKKAGGKIGGLTLTQHKRMLGDKVKSQLEVAGGSGNWHVKARCHVTTHMTRQAFQAVIVPHVDQVIPTQVDEDTEVGHGVDVVTIVLFVKVVLAEVNSFEQAAAIFGSTKLKTGTRMGSWGADKMDIVFKPRQEELRIWWTMD